LLGEIAFDSVLVYIGADFFDHGGLLGIRAQLTIFQKVGNSWKLRALIWEAGIILSCFLPVIGTVAQAIMRVAMATGQTYLNFDCNMYPPNAKNYR
jgi:hypothetical protein